MLTILTGDVIEQLRRLPDESVHCCVTSPPYWGLRDYGTAQWEGGHDSCDHTSARPPSTDSKQATNCKGEGSRDSFVGRDCRKCGAKRIDSQLGLEKTPEEYVAKMVEVFREVRRVLRKDGTLWLNLGDSFNGLKVGSTQENVGARRHNTDTFRKEMWTALKPKDLCGIPWRMAFALQADGWWLRSDIIWAKPNPMPESVTDRPTKAHEYLFLLTKSADYFYDIEAIRERTGNEGYVRSANSDRSNHHDMANHPNGRNKRSVWTVATATYPEAHFATYPPDLIKPCILAGTSAKGCCAKCGSPWERITESESFGRKRRNGFTIAPTPESSEFDNGSAGSVNTKTIGWQPTCKCYTHDEKQAIIHSDSIEAWFGSEPSGIVPCTVLDPFAGSGTTGAVAIELGRKAVLIELNPKYVELIERRCSVTMGLPLAV